MKTIIQAEVYKCSRSNDPKEIEKGFPWIVSVKSQKKFGDEFVPDYIKMKSAIELEGEDTEHLLEVEVYNRSEAGSTVVNSYYRIIRKFEASS